ncbi:MAG TPA: pilus assembly protein PilM [Usitatibacter sp.]|nr:pilus assembly protein PilM [Usitatibacter sp.]
MAALPETAARPRPAWRQKLSAFWRWWTGELAQAMPERLALLRGATRVPQVALEGEELVLVEPRAAVSPDTRVTLEGLDATRRRSAVRALLERAGETRGRARLCLAHQEALVRRVTMPAATEENLRQVLGFEMDRLTPFRAEEVYFDHRVMGRDAAAGTLAVLLAVARRDLVDARVESLRALGLSVQGVTVRDDVAAGPGSALDLLPSEQRGERETARDRLLKRVLAVIVVGLLLAALGYPIYRKREAVIALMPQVARAQVEAASTDTVARELERQVTDYNFLLARKHGAHSVLAYVEDVSRLLPDNTWVQQFDLKQSGKTREVQITGETVSSSRLIEILEQSQLLQNAAPRGTVTRGTLPNTERFMIAAEVRPRPAPEARGITEAAAAPVAPAPAAPVAPPTAPPGTPAAKLEPVPPPAAPPKADAKPDPKAAPKTAPGK